MTGQPHEPALIPTSPIPVSGVIDVRVRYCECDPMGVAHHAAYIPWLEIGRTELLRASGITYAQLEGAGVFLVITKLEAKYRRPIFYDDLIQVKTRVAGGSRIKILHEYELLLAEDGAHGGSREPRVLGDVMAVAATTLACVDRNGRVSELPSWLASRET